MKIKVFFLSLILLTGLTSWQVNAQVTVSGSTSQDGSYTNLASAFTAIGTSQAGMNIVITLSANTTEPSMGAVLGAGTWNSLKIFPTVAGVTITNELISSAPLITLSGADHVIIDGRVNQTGVADMIIDRVSTDGVGSISIGGTNTGYTSAPTVTISAPTGSGTLVTATATVTISGGKVNGYTITNSGSGYMISPAPTVTLTGGGYTAAATATAAIATTHTIFFDKNAEGNTIQYCILKGNSNSNKSIVYFGTGLTGNTYGNGNNTLQNNIFTGNAGGRPLYCIYSPGAASYPNVGNKILNNEFKDFLYQKANTSTIAPIGIYIAGGATSPNNAWTITGNSFYDTGLVPAGNVTFTVIAIGASGQPAGTGYSIADNFIGGSARECGGTAWTKSNAFDNPFTGIYMALSTGTPTNSVQNNTIKNISWSNSANGIWKGMEVISGDINIGTSTGNTIGDDTSTGSINYTAATNGANVNGIYLNNSSGTVDCQNNIIGSITTNNSLAAGTTAIVGIFKSAQPGTITISNNKIGSTSVDNSLNSTNVVANQTVTGILCSGTGTNTISNNTIANMTNAGSSSGSNQGLQGIRVAGGTNTVNGNFIYNLSTPSSTSAILYGINISTSTGTYSNNIISLGNAYLNTIYGIYETGLATQNNNIYFNTVHVGGNPASGTLKSYCLYSAVITNTRDFRNNIFSNIRSNTSGSNIHYPMWIQTTGGTLTCDNNDYFKSGIGGTLGYYGANVTTLPIVTGNDANSLAVDPGFVNVGGTLAEDYKITSSVNLPGVTGTGVLFDFAGVARNTTPKMGAYETSFTTKLANAETTNTIILRNATGIVVPLSENSIIELYTMSGLLIEKTQANGSYSRELNDGMYIIRINGKSMKFIK